MFRQDSIFRTVYIQISGMLIFSSLALLVFVGGLVYVELRWQLSQDGRINLRSEVAEIQQATRSLPSTSGKTDVQVEFSDDRGQRVYFALADGTVTKAKSAHMPVPLDQLPRPKPGGPGVQFAVFKYQGMPYRVLLDDWKYQGHTLQLYVYEDIIQEHEMLEHARDVMIGAGVVGLFMAAVFNLWLAHRSLRPARLTWASHQSMLGELSHELQTPLATMSALVASQTDSPEVRENLKREIQHASNLVQDILYLSRLRAFPAHELEPVAVSDITEEVADRFAALAEQRSLTLTGQAQAGLFVETTVDNWSRVISTLFKNVVDHSHPGTEATWRLTATSTQVEFTVANVVGQRSTVLAEGTPIHGMGLLIAERISEDMNGQFSTRILGKRFIATVSVPRLKVPT